MAAKKTKKETKSTKESDEEFLKRVMGLKEATTKKVSAEVDSYSEVGEFREKGKIVAKDLEEHEECKKIVEEFKISPPIMESVHINDISFDYSCKDSSVVKKIEMLKKHGFPFLHAIKSTSTYPVNFKTYGKAYLKRGVQKIYLPETSKPPIVPDSSIGMGSGTAYPKNKGIILQDGDVLGTERDGYIYDFVDTKQNMDDHNTDIIIFPESELRITIQRETTHPEPQFMVPEQVPPAIKNATSNTVMSDSIEGIEMIRGIFKISLLRKGKNINKFITLPSKYPQVEFEPTSKLIMKTIRQMAEDAGKKNKRVGDILMAQVSKSESAGSGICDDMACFIELNYDGSLVIFGTPNNVVHRGIGKETKRVDLRKKITLTSSALYETDCSKNPDPRVDLIGKKSMAVTGYIGIVLKNQDFEERINKLERHIEDAFKPVDKETRKKLIEEDMEMLKTAEEIGDDDLISTMKQKIKTDGTPEVIPQSEIDEQIANLEKSKESYRKYKPIFKRDFEAALPAYNPPNENDKV